MNQNQKTPDAVSGDEGRKPTGRLEENLTRRSTWLRLLFMIVLVAIYAITRIVFGAVVVIQFFWVLFTAETNHRLTGVGQSLATYTYQIMRYLCFACDDRPFPFDADFPTGEPGA